MKNVLKKLQREGTDRQQGDWPGILGGGQQEGALERREDLKQEKLGL